MMAPKPDLDGLKNIYMSLGQMDSALTSHLEDARDRGDGDDHKELKAASATIQEAQEQIRVVISRWIEGLRP
jgi:hypothetical protein